MEVSLKRVIRRYYRLLVLVGVIVILISMVTRNSRAGNFQNTVDTEGRGWNTVNLEPSDMTESDLYYQKRLLQAKQQCSTISTRKPRRPRGFLHKTLPIYYCKIPKVASTFMDGFLPKLFHKEDMKKCFAVVENMNTNVLSDVSRKIQRSFSFVFVREPYGRLFSAYENKLFLPNKFWKLLGIDIIKTVRNKPISVDTGHDVTFSEMLEYVIIKSKNGKALNEHLEPMYGRCDPCRTSFDFIGKLETMDSDIESLVETWTKRKYIDAIDDENDADARKLEAKTRYEQLFGPLSKLFEKVQLKNPNFNTTALFLRTWSSYHIRGVILKEYSMPFVDERQVNSVTQEQYFDELKRAIDKSIERKEELKAQRDEALEQAYHTVPVELMMQLRQFVHEDCQLFGYDNTPDKLLNRNRSLHSGDFNYFKGMNIAKQDIR